MDLGTTSILAVQGRSGSRRASGAGPQSASDSEAAGSLASHGYLSPAHSRFPPPACRPRVQARHRDSAPEVSRARARSARRSRCESGVQPHGTMRASARGQVRESRHCACLCASRRTRASASGHVMRRTRASAPARQQERRTGPPFDSAAECPVLGPPPPIVGFYPASPRRMRAACSGSYPAGPVGCPTVLCSASS
jgi:hypothetical protein